MFTLIRSYAKTKKGIWFIRKNKKGDLEFDELGKLILAGIALLILIGIVIFVIKGSLDDESEKVTGGLNNILG